VDSLPALGGSIHAGVISRIQNVDWIDGAPPPTGQLRRAARPRLLSIC